MANPMFRDNIYQEAVIDEGQMTISGSVLKTFSLILFAVASGMYTWNLIMSGMTDKAATFMFTGAIIGFMAAIVSSFNPRISNIGAPVYAIAEGFFLGGFSANFNYIYAGIVVQAITATIITLGVMLFLYATKLVRATDKFRKIVITSTISLCIFYLIVTLAVHFHIQFLAPFVNAYDNIFVIAFAVVIASLNLILDFDFIEKGSQMYMPKYFEWYGAMGLMITLIWLYIEMLKFIARLRRN